MKRHVLRSLIAFTAVGLLLFASACGGDDKKNDDEPSFQGDAQLSSKAASFTAGPFSGMAEPDWFPIFLVLQDVSTAVPAQAKGRGVQQVVENFFNQPSVTHVFYVFFEDNPEFTASMNILSCEPPGASEVTGSVENMLKFYKENNIEARSVGTATYNATNYDIVKVSLYDEYDTYIVPIRTGDCISPATLTAKKGDTAKVEAMRAVLSKLVIDPTKMPR